MKGQVNKELPCTTPLAVQLVLEGRQMPLLSISIAKTSKTRIIFHSATLYLGKYLKESYMSALMHV